MWFRQLTELLTGPQDSGWASGSAKKPSQSDSPDRAGHAGESIDFQKTTAAEALNAEVRDGGRTITGRQVLGEIKRQVTARESASRSQYEGAMANYRALSFWGRLTTPPPIKLLPTRPSQSSVAEALGAPWSAVGQLGSILAKAGLIEASMFDEVPRIAMDSLEERNSGSSPLVMVDRLEPAYVLTAAGAGV